MGAWRACTRTVAPRFIYVGKELHPSLGYLTGWCMVMDYILNPLICTIWCSTAAGNFLPGIPYFVWAIFFATLFTLLNLNGVETSARINSALAAALGVVIVLFVGEAVRWTLAHPLHLERVLSLSVLRPQQLHLSRTLPRHLDCGAHLYRLRWHLYAYGRGPRSRAHRPAGNRAHLLHHWCSRGIEVYLGQLVWPHHLHFRDLDTAFVQLLVSHGGARLFIMVNAALLMATIGSGMASQLGAARLLLAMGQDGAIPRRFFGAVHPKNRIPRNNVLLIGGICLVGALVFSYQLGTELLNYGALLAFMGVNLASMLRGWRHGRITQWAPILVSLGGLITCALLWWNLGPLAKAAGTSWAMVGVLLWIVRRRSTVLPGEAV